MSRSVETAKFTPMSVSPAEAKIADIMPTRRPCRSTSAPPELPGLAAASVWTKSSTGLKPASVTFSAETTPHVTERPRPNELPMAHTGCASRGAGAMATGGRRTSTRRSAMSLAASFAASRAGRMRPSESRTSIRRAGSTTCQAVAISPGRSTTPLPSGATPGRLPAPPCGRPGQTGSTDTTDSSTSAGSARAGAGCATANAGSSAAARRNFRKGINRRLRRPARPRTCGATPRSGLAQWRCGSRPSGPGRRRCCASSAGSRPAFRGT